MKRSAEFSPCRRYRYTLTRDWTGLHPLDRGYVNFIGLNPSTADENLDDPTIRRCMGFTSAWGYDKLVVTNLFAFRATDPIDMKKAEDPEGYDNTNHIIRVAFGAALVVACWGVHGSFRDRDKQIKALIPDLRCLYKTKDGHPGHPLYLPKGLELILL